MPTLVGAFVVPALTARAWAPEARVAVLAPRTPIGRAMTGALLAVHAALEELAFRSWCTSRRAGAGRVLVPALVFGALHWARGGPRAAVCQGVNAVAWGSCARANRSVFWPGVAHALYNATILFRPATLRCGGSGR